MSTPDGGLHRLFAPRKVAVVGASDGPQKVANRGIHYMVGQGFAGEIYGVNPGTVASQAVPMVKRVDDLPDGVDVAVLAVPAAQIVDSVIACGRKGIAFAIIFANGFADVGDVALQARLVDAAKKGGVRIVGPNCLGVLDLHSHFAGTFSSMLYKGRFRHGPVGLVSQSGAVGNSVLLSYQGIDLGIAAWLATGNEVDVEAMEGLEYMLARDDTEVVVAVLEAVTDAGHRLRALGRDSLRRGKPVLVFKAGRSDASRRAAESHTGKIVGNNQAWRQIIDDSGLLPVDSLEDLLDVSQAMGQCGWRRMGKVAIFCGSGGVGGVICDDLSAAGIELARLSEATVTALRAVLPSGASTGNPVDPTTVSEETYYRAADLLVRDAAVDVLILAMNSLARDYATTPSSLLRLSQTARGLGKSIAITYFSPFDKLTDEAEHALSTAGVLIAPTSARLARTLGTVMRWHRLTSPAPQANEAATDTHSHAPTAKAASVMQALPELTGLLARYGIPVVPTSAVETVADALAVRRRPDEKIVLKLESSSIAHKTDAGLVRLGLASESDVAAALADLTRLRGRHGGVIVAQPLLTNAVEVIIGGMTDSELGRLVTIGLGGVFVELIGEMALSLCPVDVAEATSLLGRGRLPTMLAGYRGSRRRDVEALAKIVSAVSRLLADRPDIVEFELNPVMVAAEGDGALVVDALARLSPPTT